MRWTMASKTASPQHRVDAAAGAAEISNGDARDKPATGSVFHVCFREDSFAYAGASWRGLVGIGMPCQQAKVKKRS